MGTLKKNTEDLASRPFPAGDYSYRVSVIVPVYNKEACLDKAMDSLLAQDIPAGNMEVLLVDDGSDDESSAMCDAWAARREWICAFHKKNGGVSSARNYGIRRAHGRYLMYLDPDDTLAPDTVSAVVDFFDAHCDEIDLVIYPLTRIRNGRKMPPHYRSKVLDEEGVYDLSAGHGIFAAATTIEVCVKNKGTENILFSEEMPFHEDQKYNTDILLQKMKIGFCSRGRYNYNQGPQGVVGMKFNAYHLFEGSMAFWEEEFASFHGRPPKYLQALYLSDLAWKTRSGILYPYHYAKPEFEHACGRILSLLDQVESDVIARHPALDDYERAYFLQMKRNCAVRCLYGPGGIVLLADGGLVYEQEEVEIVLLRMKPTRSGFEMTAFLKSPCFQFGEKPVLVARQCVDGRIERRELSLFSSSHSYYKSKTKTNVFWDFNFTLDYEKSGSVEFFVRFGGEQFRTYYCLMPRAGFCASRPVRNSIVLFGHAYRLDKSIISGQVLAAGEVARTEREHDRASSSNLRNYSMRRLVRWQLARGRRVWLYHDCHGVEKNNAYFQYMHDIGQNDGVERFYVVNDDLAAKRHLFTRKQMGRVVRFGSRRHKELFLVAERIVTAYVERANWVPLDASGLRRYGDLFHAEISYLQHGVLHAHMPWKYSLDRLLIDEEIVSTPFEEENLCENYGFSAENIVPAGMPRYDFIDASERPKHKILLAPSWRKFLVRYRPQDGQWEATVPQLLESDFYRETKAFLENEELHRLLEDFDYTLDLKLHPILQELYAAYFTSAHERVRIAPESVHEADYAVFITDFSSYRFDFVYLKRAILYFFPDEDFVKAGTMDYRELDLPLDGMFGELTRDADSAIGLLRDILENGGKPKERFARQMEDFFYHYDSGQCERIYRELGRRSQRLQNPLR